MKKNLVLTVLFLAVLGLFLSNPKEAKAYSPIISSCSNGVLDNTAMLTGLNTIQQLFEVRLDHYYLDAVAVRLDAVDEPTPTTVSVIDRDRGEIASTSKTVSMTESWVYFDFDNVPITRGVYLLQVYSSPANPVAWKYATGTCIDDSHLIYNGDVRLDVDMGFAIYAYDNSASTSGSAPAPANNSASAVPDSQDPDSANFAPGETSDGTVPQDNPPGDSKTPTQSGTTSSSRLGNDYPSKEDILKMSQGNDGLSALGIFGALFGSPIAMILSSVISFFIFVGIILLVIYLVIRSRRKKDVAKKKEEKV